MGRRPRGAVEGVQPYVASSGYGCETPNILFGSPPKGWSAAERVFELAQAAILAELMVRAE